ncbi:MAG TPA: prepilin-type N-terminal cleavage/methylation domain-containing protein [Solirubrobacteraceae bacterium]|nr:prepilin-type N-terminal cleavage/methylation domain-containing protein [Solirubrobacteraceae bacterium]
MSKPTLPRALRRLGDERGLTLIELLVAMIIGLVVTGALLATLELALRQNTSISDRAQADRTGRTAMNAILEQLHSSCTGFGSTAIQGPSTTPVSPLASTGGANLWLLSAYGNSTSGNASVSSVVQHDINWSSTGTSNTGQSVGTLTDYAFTGTGESPNWTFSTLSTANATAKVLAKNVVPLSTSTVFHYWRYDTTLTDSTYGELIEVSASEIPALTASKKIAQVTISYKQAPEKSARSEVADTREGHTATFTGSVVLRFTPPESATEGATCT